MDAAIRHANPEQGGEIVQTSADRLLAEGRAETLAWQLADRFGDLPADVRERLESASPEAVKAWALAFLKADSLEALFQAQPKAR